LLLKKSSFWFYQFGLLSAFLERKHFPKVWIKHSHKQVAHYSTKGPVTSGGFSDIKKKLHPSGNCEINLMILINLLLAHVGTVAFKGFHGLIRFKRFVSRFFRELRN
jgi:hypothetical protein